MTLVESGYTLRVVSLLSIVWFACMGEVWVKFVVALILLKGVLNLFNLKNPKTHD